MAKPHYESTPSAHMLAVIVVYLRLDFEKAHSRTISRFRIATKTLRRYSRRSRISDEFMAEIVEELWSLGWSAFPSGEHLAVIASNVVLKWPQVSAVRARDTLDEIENEGSREWNTILKAVANDET